METIADSGEAGKGRVFGLPRDVVLVLILLLATTAAFMLGYLAGKEAGGGKEGIWIENMAEAKAGPAAAAAAPVQKTAPAPAVAEEAAYVASKNGTKYHLPWCSGALRIKEENKVWFASKAEAEAAGYEPAANCKGI